MGVMSRLAVHSEDMKSVVSEKMCPIRAPLHDSGPASRHYKQFLEAAGDRIDDANTAVDAANGSVNTIDTQPDSR